MEQTRMSLFDTNSPASSHNRRHNRKSFKGTSNNALQHGSLVNMLTGKKLLQTAKPLSMVTKIATCFIKRDSSFYIKMELIQ